MINKKQGEEREKNQSKGHKRHKKSESHRKSDNFFFKEREKSRIQEEMKRKK